MLELGSTPAVEAPTYPPLVAVREEPTDVKGQSLSTAELAECTCPEYCERDHDTD